MKSWIIQIKNKANNERITVYPNGLVYGTRKGEKLFNLSEYAMQEIKDLLNENIYSLKKDNNTNYMNNGLILRIQCPSRKYNMITIEGWNQTPRLMNIIINKDNWINYYLRVADNN